MSTKKTFGDILDNCTHKNMKVDEVDSEASAQPWAQRIFLL